MRNTGREEVLWNGISYRKHVILADVNIPYKLSIDRKNNNLFFCINADEFTDQSFQSVVLNLDTGLASIIPGIRNGFASAVDQTNSDVYLGGSNGIFKYDYSTNDIIKPPLVNNIDIFDMYFSDNLYFVDTGSQNLHIYKENKCYIIDLNGSLIQHFIIDYLYDLYYVNRHGLFMLSKTNDTPVLLDRNGADIRGAAIDVYGTPYFIAQDGIYSIGKDSQLLTKILSVRNGNGLAFDKNNNMIFCEDRSIVILLPN